MKLIIFADLHVLQIIKIHGNLTSVLVPEGVEPA